MHSPTFLQEAEIARKEVELARKEAELTEAEKATRREQQEIQEKRQQVSLEHGVVCGVCCNYRGPPDCRRPS